MTAERACEHSNRVAASFAALRGAVAEGSSFLHHAAHIAGMHQPH